MNSAAALIKNPSAILKSVLSLFLLGWSVILFIPSAPFVPRYATDFLPWRIEILSAILLLPFAVWQMRRLDPSPFVTFSRAEIFLILLPLLAFIGWSGVSFGWANFPLATVHHTLVWAEYLLFYLAVRQIIKHPADLRLLIYGLMPVIWLIGLPAIIEYYSSVALGNAANGIGFRYASYAELMNALLPLVLAVAVRSKGVFFRLALLTALIICLLDISSLSRTALILLVFVTTVFSAMIFIFKQFTACRRPLLKILCALIFVPVTLQIVPFLYSQQIPILERYKYKAHIEESNGTRPFFSGVALEMLEAQPLTGIGADNYGYQFDNYRAIYGDKHPGSPYMNIAENEVPERAHNEFAQIAAELGIIGLALFAVLVGSVIYLSFAALQRRRFSIYGNAALLGIVSFLISSMITSYSFRAVTNGTVFFFLLAVAVFALDPKKSVVQNSPSAAPRRATILLRPIYGFGAIACLLMIIFCTVRVLSVNYAQRAAAETDTETAANLYQKAFRFDRENFSAYFSNGMKLVDQGRYAEAIPLLHRSIGIRHTRVTDYSLLATAQTLAGDNRAATDTFRQAVRRYPLSVFARTRYALLLKSDGDDAAANEQYAVALSINPENARTWKNLIGRGAKAATEAAFADSSNTQIMDLKPELAIYAVIMEREIVHPEEKFVIPSQPE